MGKFSRLLLILVVLLVCFGTKFRRTASSFSISRRRMVVPIYKQWTANTIRIQIVEQDNILQLLAFFEDFSHADAMNFQLKPQDVFEKVDKGGKSSLKLVDCKFALPVEERRGEGKMGKEEGRLTGWAGMKRRFVCLDQIEYPGEHDDVLISFDNAESKCCDYLGMGIRLIHLQLAIDSLQRYRPRRCPASSRFAGRSEIYVRRYPSIWSNLFSTKMFGLRFSVLHRYTPIVYLLLRSSLQYVQVLANCFPLIVSFSDACQTPIPFFLCRLWDLPKSAAAWIRWVIGGSASLRGCFLSCS